MKDILFLPLDIPYLTLDYDKLVSVAQTLDTIADEYRNCEHIPIRWTSSVNNSYNKLEWTDITHNEFPEIIEYAEQHLKPFVGEIPRIMIITTPPNTEGFDHIDCSPKSFDDVQLKFRSVLHGKTSTLYFLNEQGEREYAPEIGQQPFLMDGSWPHGLDNFTDKYKFTISNNQLISMRVIEDGSAIGAFTKWLVSTNYCDDESVNAQNRCAIEQCLSHLNNELSSFL